MSRSALFILSSDPRQSHQPAEAIRIAAGILPWKKIRVQVYLHHPFLQALANHPESILGQDHVQRFLPMLTRPPETAFAPQSPGIEFELDGEIHRLNGITPPELAQLRNSSTWLLHF